MNTGSVFSGLGRVLIVSSVEKASDFVREMLADFYPETVVTVAGGAPARQLFGDGCAFDYVFVNLPLNDETGVELCEQIAADRPATAVLAMVRAELIDTVGVRLSEHGVFSLTKPVVRANFASGVRLMMTSQARVDRMDAQLERMRMKLDEQSYVFRAKLALVRARAMSESEAHRYIEKRAMDTRRKRRDVAADIIAEYEDE